MLPFPAAILLAVIFTDIALPSGISFVHSMGKSGEKMMVETMGSGGGFFDFDNDGDLDLYLVNGAPLPGYRGATHLTNALYRNDYGSFTNVTSASGTGDPGYGMGTCAGDFDNDGFTDLFVTNFGPDRLYRNAGDGTFSDATVATGLTDPYWSTSCAFLDADADGDLDLFVANYVDFAPERNKFCGDYPNNVRAYCHPNVYRGQPDSLYRNEGDGTFTEVGLQSGLTARDGNGLGAVTADYDGDGDIDLYVANDKTPNTLYQNDGGGRFEDVTLLAGVGYGLNGEAQAGMGTDFGDYDGDGDFDIVVTNLDFENNSLFRNEGGGLFSDVSFPSGIGAISLSFVGFGAEFFDFDNDGRLDLAVANGHILDNAPYFNDATTYAQRNFLFKGEGAGRMTEVGLQSGAAMMSPNVGRGLAVGDIDNDGDLDMMVTVCGGAPRLLRNDGGNAAGWIGLKLIGRASNRSALGARVTFAGPVGPIVEEVRSGGSYLSQSDLRIHLGLGTGEVAAAAPEVAIRWPSGHSERIRLPGVNRYMTVLEGEGVLP